MHAKRKEEEEEEGTKREREREREEVFMAVREVISAWYWGGRLSYECGGGMVRGFGSGD